MIENNKIGEFIQVVRKEKGYTQKELAEMIHVSDKTISKWENGNSIPDTEILSPLCEALHINVNELISGRRLEPKDYSQKAEENLMELLEKDEKNKKSGKLLFMFGAILIVVAFLLNLVTIGAKAEWYFDIPSLVLIFLAMAGIVLLSGKRKAREVVPFARKIIIPLGAIISLMAAVIVLTKWFTKDISTIGPVLAICLLSMVYAFVIYIALMIVESHMN